MTRFDSTPTDLAGVAKQAHAWLSMLQSQLADAGAAGVAIRDALTGLAGAIDAITAAKAKITTVLTDPSRTTQYKLDQARSLVGDSYSAALRSALDLAAALDKARTQLASSIMPSKPSGADAAMMAFTAGQIAQTLEAVGDELHVVKAAAQLLAEALARGDMVQAYLVAGGPMQLLYQRKGVPMAALAQAFAEVIDKADARPTSGGASLLPAVTMGGSGTLRGLVDAARLYINEEQGAYNAWLQASAAIGTLRGVWGK
jgi:hypothetical protein